MGRLVGGALKYPFLDTDSLIEASAGCSIPELFEKEGEDAFRELETQILQARPAQLHSSRAEFGGGVRDKLGARRS